MEIHFRDEYLEELAENKKFTGKPKFPEEVVIAYKKRIFQVKGAKGTQDLRQIKSLHFEKLKEKKFKDKYSIRLNKAYRLIFEIGKDDRLEIMIIEEINNHYA
ncbi:type II toxin-antitoxin system RelE/ParE family toxin [Pedobacter sp. MR2016-19]|uniref:Proteic killer suppression protein n=1 Tax=Pedobacter psychrodurus TaxID=2530456 RepID=A0A4R0QA52_9SPHI|nr:MULTISPECIES: type II toxin-antitoxin system RelE/ParE family toxin [Pedobacter]MBE5318156.1 type II toxin-antitoxin system RelE/ParE family toxin [Pedobacter sp. MR2016-19]TCD28925.1 hypothetical protein EZ456_01825 [Pedobacter psychrodurus]